MNQEIKTIVKKTAKIAGVTCVAAGAVALMTSAAAIKAMSEGVKYLKSTVQKIIDDDSEPKETEMEVQAEETAAEPVAEAEDVKEEAPAAEETV